MNVRIFENLLDRPWRSYSDDTASNDDDVAERSTKNPNSRFSETNKKNVCVYFSIILSKKKKYCRAICRSRYPFRDGTSASFFPSFLPSTLFTVNGLDKREFVDSIRSMFCMVRTREIRASAFSKRESLNLVFRCS